MCDSKLTAIMIIIINIILFYQFGTGGHTQKARPVQGAYP